MECIHIDFDVLETNNPKKLMVGDTSSNWSTASEKPAYLSITLPGSKEEKTFVFTKGSLVVYNSNNLGLSELQKECKQQGYIDLPDGIYKLKLQTGFEEHFKEKYYLKTDIIEKEIAKKIVDNALNSSTNNKAFIDCLVEIDYKLKVARSFMRECDVVNVKKYYNEAIIKFKNL